MPKIGEVARCCDVGVGKGYHKCIWHACIECGKERWVILRNGKPQSQRCYPCGRLRAGRATKGRRGPQHWHWQGGRSITKQGYVEVWVDAASPFFPMTNKDGYVYEHRLVMAQHLGRCLETEEEVHHRNKNKQDNRLENLEILSRRDHAFRHQDMNYLMQQVAVMESEIQRLRGLLYEQQASPS